MAIDIEFIGQERFLIVEFAKMLKEEGMTLVEATVRLADVKKYVISGENSFA